MIEATDRRPALVPRRSRVRFLSPATLRALTAAHDALVCAGWRDAAATLIEGVHNGASLVTTIRRLNVAEWHATAHADDVGDALDAHRAKVAADACGHATRSLLADYERAAERD